jgi:hypothetical protein
MKKRSFRLLSLAAVLAGTALLSSARPAAARCIPGFCWMVNENTTCCWGETCQLECG